MIARKTGVKLLRKEIVIARKEGVMLLRRITQFADLVFLGRAGIRGGVARMIVTSEMD